MAFTVTRAGASDDEFVEYARMVRKLGKSLANLPRVPDPHALQRRWVPSWPTREEAEAFVRKIDTDSFLKTTWEVVEVEVEPTTGPLLSPLPVQIMRGGAGFLLALHPLCQHMIRELFPGTAPCLSVADVDTETWNDFRRTQGNLNELVKRVLPMLTGFEDRHVVELGFVVIDDKSFETVAYLQPVSLTRVQSGPDSRSAAALTSEVA